MQIYLFLQQQRRRDGGASRARKEVNANIRGFFAARASIIYIYEQKAQKRGAQRFAQLILYIKLLTTRTQQKKKPQKNVKKQLIFHILFFFCIFAKNLLPPLCRICTFFSSCLFFFLLPVHFHLSLSLLRSRFSATAGGILYIYVYIYRRGRFYCKARISASLSRPRVATGNPQPRLPNYWPTKSSLSLSCCSRYVCASFHVKSTL